MDDTCLDAYMNIVGHILKTQVSKKVKKLIKLANLSLENVVILIYLIYKFNANKVIKVNDKKLPGYIILISLILSNKILNDQSYTHKSWLSLFNSCNIKVVDLSFINNMEIFFLTCLNYNINFQFINKDDDFWLLLMNIENLATVNRFILVMRDDVNTIINTSPQLNSQDGIDQQSPNISPSMNSIASPPSTNYPSSPNEIQSMASITNSGVGSSLPTTTIPMAAHSAYTAPAYTAPSAAATSHPASMPSIIPPSIPPASFPVNVTTSTGISGFNFTNQGYNNDGYNIANPSSFATLPYQNLNFLPSFLTPI